MMQKMNRSRVNFTESQDINRTEEFGKGNKDSNYIRSTIIISNERMDDNAVTELLLLPSSHQKIKKKPDSDAIKKENSPFVKHLFFSKIINKSTKSKTKTASNLLESYKIRKKERKNN